MAWVKRAAFAAIGLVLFVLGGFIALNWAPDRDPGELAERWGRPPSAFIHIDGLDVHLRDEGPREDPLPIVLLHGTSSSLHTWDGWAAQLSTTRRVVRMDLPGFALTGPDPEGDYRPERYTRFVLAVMDKLGLNRVVLGGNSLGGGIAWATALRAPDRIAALVLVDAAGYPSAPQSVPIGFRLAQTPPFNHIFNYILPRSIIEDSLRNVYGDPRRVTDALVDQYFDMTVRTGNRGALAQKMAQTRWDGMSAQIKTIRQPTLIIWGARDHLIPPENAARFHADIAGSTLAMLPGLGHVPQEEDPQASAVPLMPFLEQLKP